MFTGTYPSTRITNMHGLSRAINYLPTEGFFQLITDQDNHLPMVDLSRDAPSIGIPKSLLALIPTKIVGQEKKKQVTTAIKADPLIRFMNNDKTPPSLVPQYDEDEKEQQQQKDPHVDDTVNGDSSTTATTNASIASNSDDEEIKTCSICLELMADGQKARILACKHEYHLNCIDEWLKEHINCPSCRQRAFDEKALVRDHTNLPREITDFLKRVHDKDKATQDNERIREQRRAQGNQGSRPFPPTNLSHSSYTNPYHDSVDVFSDDINDDNDDEIGGVAWTFPDEQQQHVNASHLDPNQWQPMGQQAMFDSDLNVLLADQVGISNSDISAFIRSIGFNVLPTPGHTTTTSSPLFNHGDLFDTSMYSSSSYGTINVNQDLNRNMRPRFGIEGGEERRTLNGERRTTPQDIVSSTRIIQQSPIMPDYLKRMCCTNRRMDNQEGLLNRLLGI